MEMMISKLPRQPPKGFFPILLGFYLLWADPLTHLPQFAVPFRKIIWTLVQQSEWKQPLVFEKGM